MFDHVKNESTQEAIDATIQSLTLSISNSQFSYNLVKNFGAVIYLDELDFYDLALTGNTFEKNTAASQADNVYIKQTKQGVYEA